jgi:hypothetical protein
MRASGVRVARPEPRRAAALSAITEYLTGYDVETRGIYIRTSSSPRSS